MELRHLRYFVAVAEERHVTRAARRLGIQQPPLSLSIKALETELGTALFTRTARGVELTAAGTVFLRDAITILADVDRAADAALQAARGQSGRLSIGFTTSALLHPIVPELLGAFHDSHGQVELDMREGNAAELTEALSLGKLQAALLRIPPLRPPGVAFLDLGDEALLAVLPRGHRLLPARSGVDLAELAQDPFILVRRPGAAGIYANVIEACRAAGFEPKVVAEVGHMLTNINLVAAGLGVSLVPASMRGINATRVGYARIRKGAADLVAPLTLGHGVGDASPILADFIAIARQLSKRRYPGIAPTRL